MTLPWLIGQLLNQPDPRVTMFTILAVVLLGFVVYSLLMVYGGHRGKRRNECGVRSAECGVVSRRFRE